MTVVSKFFGGTLINLKKVYHGIATPIKIIKEDYLFKNLPETFNVGRYHSWVVDKISEDIEITSIDENGEIMSIRHKYFDVKGFQFHPESILTPSGKSLIKNWIKN